MIVTDDDCERALDYLRKTDSEYAQVKATRNQLEHSRKHILAKLARESGEPSAAKADPEYKEFLDNLEKVHQNEVTLENRRATAQTVISVWQSLTRRGL